MINVDTSNNPHAWQDYAETAQCLLLTLAEVQAEFDGRFVKCSRVIRRFLESQGRLTDSARQALDDIQKWDRDVDTAYQVIVGLCRDETDFRMIDGRGNFGTPTRGWLPTPPCYTEVSLTDRGRRLVAENAR